MRSTTRSLLILVYMICSLHLITFTNTLNKVQKSHSKAHLKLETKDAKDSAILIGACFKGAFAAIPPAFCLKKGGSDFLHYAMNIAGLIINL